MVEFELCREDAADVAEDYCLGHLPEAEKSAFEDHYLGCVRCAALVQEADRYTRAMRAAAVQLKPAAPQEDAGTGV